MNPFPHGRAAVRAVLALVLGLGGSAFAAEGPFAEPVFTPTMPATDEMSGRRVALRFDPEPSTHRVPAPPEPRLLQKGLSTVQATITVNFLPPGIVDGDNCIAWTTAARNAFTYAANVWASQLQSPVPIVIDACYASNMESGTLGYAGAYTNLRNFTNAPLTNTWYPVALANAFAGADLRPTSPDIYAAFNANYTWYYGTDGNTPWGQLDFASVVMHEVGHGLGFAGSMDVSSGGSGSWGFGTGLPFGYDRFTRDAPGQSLINTAVYGNPSATLATVLRSNAVFFDGPNANAGNGGTRVPLYAPGSWNGGSSYSHLAESYNGSPNALMTFALSSGESIHNPGPVALGLLRDLGWTLQSASTADVGLTQAINANPASAGKDAVFTMTATNHGPGTATGVTVNAAYDASATVVWASPGCVKQGASALYACSVGTLADGAAATFKLVLRKGAAGAVYNNAGVSSATSDPNSANNSPMLAVTVGATAAGVPIFRYRLYSDVTKEHHFTTDLNEYNVLGAQVGTWVKEGTVGRVLDNPGAFNGVAAAPYYRLYNTAIRQHHWTTDANEYYTLQLHPGWQGEGVDGYVLPTRTAGATQLFRLLYPFVAGLHHWTIDANEYNTLIAQYGWMGEGGSGFVIQ